MLLLYFLCWDPPNGITTILKAEIFSQTFAKNCTLHYSGLIPSSLPLSRYFMFSIKIFRNDVFHTQAGLNPRMANGPHGVPRTVLKICASVIALCLLESIFPFLLELFLYSACS